VALFPPLDANGNLAKKCSKCKEIKALAAFCRIETSPDGRNHRCRECANLSCKQWRDTHPQRAKQKKAAWEKANRDWCRAYASKWAKTPKGQAQAESIPSLRNPYGSRVARATRGTKPCLYLLRRTLLGQHQAHTGSCGASIKAWRTNQREYCASLPCLQCVKGRA